jgi:glutaredoxin
VSGNQNSYTHEMPVGSPYCSDPSCPYCKELREIAEELRRKQQTETLPESGH